VAEAKAFAKGLQLAIERAEEVLKLRAKAKPRRRPIAKDEIATTSRPSKAERAAAKAAAAAAKAAAAAEKRESERKKREARESGVGVNAGRAEARAEALNCHGCFDARALDPGWTKPLCAAGVVTCGGSLA